MGKTAHAIQRLLIVLGFLGTLYGLYLLLTTTKPTSVLGLSIWLLAALVLHDGILSPLVYLGNLVLKRVGRAYSWTAVAIIQVGVALAFVLTLLAVPMLGGQAHGARNATVVNLDYQGNLLVSLIVVMSLMALSLTGIYIRARRKHQG